MSGGLVVLGFLFLTFLFRSAIVGDIAPLSHARAALPRASLPPPPRERPAVGRAPVRARTFDEGRRSGREAPRGLDEALQHVRTKGVDARITRAGPTWKAVRLYACPTCDTAQPASACEYERGLLAGAFESVSGELTKVEELACAQRGDAHCEFRIGHAALAEAV